VKYCEALAIYGVYICSVFFQQESKIRVSSEDSIMDTVKSFVVFAIQPFLLPFEGEDLGLLEAHFVVPFESKLNDLMVVVVSGHMEQSAVLVVEDFIDFR
jgi:hypothetical protein